MALIKLFKLGSAGLPQEHDAASDDVSLNSLTLNSLTVSNFTATASNTVRDTYTAAATIALNDVVYLSAADSVSPADADLEATARVIGLATNASSAGGLVTVQKLGALGGFAGLTPGARYFLSTTAGAVTTTVPVGHQNAVIQVGYAKNTTTLDLQVEPVVVRYTS